MVDLQEIEAIKRLKYRYVRCLDQKRWKELEECFTEDAEAAYSDGKYSFSGRGKIMEFLTGAMSANSMITSHTVHHPEIDFRSETAATGVWALTDTVIETSANITIRGAAFYQDEYVKIDGQWKIKSTGYKRIFEEVVSRGDTPSLKLTASCWKKD